MTYLNSDRLPDNSVVGGKLANKSITEDKLDSNISDKITNSNTIVNTLLQAFTEANGNASHLEDPFVRANLIPIPFEDAEVKRVLVENYSTTGDGELWYKDAENVTTLGNSSKGEFTFQGNKNVCHFREYRFFPKATLHTTFFTDCINLEDIEFPEGIKTFRGSYVFKNCIRLKLNYLPDSLEDLGFATFQDCKEITLTKLPENLKYIRYYSLGGCTKCDITVVPKGVTRLEEGNWGNNTNLISKHLTVLSPTITDFGWMVFEGYDWIAFEACTTPPPLDSSHQGLGTDAIVYVPDDAVDTYKGATNWKDLGDRIKPLSEKPATT